ncbi:cell envelope integrity protein CreD [Stenotrophomonas sp. SY1]|jgi:inner membrane protein|uniref:cell envelope integrity protein CreD n=1 Tax=Stenotrophomonas sp. SY1 TaxID=477235 RepID=UPI001E374E52|nr:cell envelope integrity protein CreD [Stenotrophomonas sp. SY1]MCD9087647.1 cell envelope integrity protein CreD [Stenotrophomonas sp. SY1]
MTSLKLLLRFAIVGGLVLLLLIPLMLIRGTINERERYRDEAITRVAQSRAGEQTLIGPVRVLPWTQQREVEVVVEGSTQRKTELRTEQGYDLQMPRRLNVQGKIRPDERRVGLFKVPVYSWQAKLQAEFAPASYRAVEGRTYGRPYLALGIADVRGLVGTPNLRVDGRAVPLQAGSGVLEETSKGLHAPLNVLADSAQGMLTEGNKVELEFVLDGTRSLSVVPVGDDTRVALDSPWPHPQFAGSFLPNERTVDDSGFKAEWAVSSLASAAQSQLLKNIRGVGGSVESLDVALVDPVDVYTQADRATKYGILFVLLTFVGFALFELIKQLKIHPLQYLLVGLALAIFFLLLVSLSEQIAFWQAYLISAAACIGLQGFYLSGVLRSWKYGLMFSTMLTLLYGVLFMLLGSENNALLMGSLLLFGILAVIMWITRKVDWYELSNRSAAKPATPPTLP